jgi:hypothetical protein
MQPDPIPGFVPRSKWAAQLGKSDYTVKRWQDAGKIVVRYFGKDPYVRRPHPRQRSTEAATGGLTDGRTCASRGQARRRGRF